MLLLFSAFLSVAMGSLVGVAGQERRAKIWFLLLCASTTLLSIGLWVEVNVADWAFFAARANMTSAFLIAAMGLLSARAMCGWRLNITVMILLTLVSVVDIATVWATNLYFTGEIYHYAWGIYVAGNRLLFITPLLTTIVSLYGMLNLWTNSQKLASLGKEPRKVLTSRQFIPSTRGPGFLTAFWNQSFCGAIERNCYPALSRNVQLRNAALPFVRISLIRQSLGRMVSRDCLSGHCVRADRGNRKANWRSHRTDVRR